MRSTIASLLALGATGCLPAPPPSAVPPEVLATAGTARPTAALLVPYAGRYVSGNETLYVRHAGERLVVERPGLPPVALSLVGLGAFSDGAGSAYLFTPAGGGAVTRLTIIAANGTRRHWTR